MTPTSRDHVLAASHLVLGPTNFLVLRLPTNWDLRIGRNPSEVDYTFTYEGVRWAQQGQAYGFVIDEQSRQAMELELRTARGALKPPRLEHVQEARYTVYGHPATALLGEARYGLFRNKPFNMLHVAYRCDETQRHIVLQLTSRRPPKELGDLLPVLADSRCH